jgi:DNA-binding LacI/PurR family transcriptional regulator
MYKFEIIITIKCLETIIIEKQMTRLKELVKRASVNIYTISRSHSNSSRVKPETKELIKRLAKQNDDVPDDLTRGLADNEHIR